MSLISIWAKKSESDESYYHPLLYHSIDSATVAKTMLEKFLSLSNTTLLCDPFISSGFSKDQSISMISFLIGLHDIGKANPIFQMRRTKTKKELLTLGFDFPYSDEPYISHGMITSKFLFPALIDIGYPLEEARRISFCLGIHHCEYPTINTFNLFSYIERGNSNWIKSRQSIFYTLMDIFDINKSSISTSLTIKSASWYLHFIALIKAADWISSMNSLFGLNSADFDPNHYMSYISTPKAIMYDRYYPKILFPPNGFSKLTNIKILSELLAGNISVNVAKSTDKGFLLNSVCLKEYSDTINNSIYVTVPFINVNNVVKDCGL